MPRDLLSAALALAVASLSASPAARGAESYDNCTGFIDSVPATITTQGVWCLRKDLSTSIQSGSAISVNTNNVTIDCNGFKLGGLAAGDGSQAVGISSPDRSNITVRQCNIRGFLYGIQLGYGGDGHLVEDNRLDNNLVAAIYVGGEASLIRRNMVRDTGGSTAFPFVWRHGIYAAGDVMDNQIEGVYASAGDTIVSGIYLNGAAATARNNIIRELSPSGSAPGYGIKAFSNASSAIGNHVVADRYAVVNNRTVHGVGLQNVWSCRDNEVNAFSEPLICEESIGNVVKN